MELDFHTIIYSVFLVPGSLDILIFSDGNGDVFIYDLLDQRVINSLNLIASVEGAELISNSPTDIFY